MPTSQQPIEDLPFHYWTVVKALFPRAAHSILATSKSTQAFQEDKVGWRMFPAALHGSRRVLILWFHPEVKSYSRIIASSKQSLPGLTPAVDLAFGVYDPPKRLFLSGTGYGVLEEKEKEMLLSIGNGPQLLNAATDVWVLTDNA